MKLKLFLLVSFVAISTAVAGVSEWTYFAGALGGVYYGVSVDQVLTVQAFCVSGEITFPKKRNPDFFNQLYAQCEAANHDHNSGTRSIKFFFDDSTRQITGFFTKHNY